MSHDPRSSDEMPASCAVEGDGPAANGAVAVCSGRWLIGGLTLRTVYVSFQPGVVAAVKMVNRPLFFGRWAASIRHQALDDRRSRVVYTYNFHAHPRWLTFLLEPILAIVFRWETRRRLRALAHALLR